MKKLLERQTGRDSYLLEFRLSGSARDLVKQLAFDVSAKFHVKGVTDRRVVPHVTLVGPFSATDEKRLVRTLDEVANDYDLVTFKLDGFRSFGNWLTGKRVLAINVEPSSELNRLRSELVKRLAEFCQLDKHDKKEFKPHATIAFKDIDRKFGEIKKFLDKVAVPPIRHHVLRITLMKGGRILREYDLLQRRSLTRSSALNADVRKTTLAFLKHRLDGTDAGYSPENPLVLPPDSRVFLISDLHFDHANIIRYCNRPFRTREEMNGTLLRNWNAVVRASDTVYFLGDLTFGPDRHPADYWLGRLNGRIFFIRGNHDADLIHGATELPNNFVVQYRDHLFMLAHKPNRPAYWTGWIIHGDKHNNHLAEYPFMNRARITVNVSAEVVNYKPISIEEVLSEVEGRDFHREIRP